jgi:hypothetical protein
MLRSPSARNAFQSQEARDLAASKPRSGMLCFPIIFPQPHVKIKLRRQFDSTRTPSSHGFDGSERFDTPHRPNMRCQIIRLGGTEAEPLRVRGVISYHGALDDAVLPFQPGIRRLANLNGISRTTTVPTRKDSGDANTLHTRGVFVESFSRLSEHLRNCHQEQ